MASMEQPYVPKYGYDLDAPVGAAMHGDSIDEANLYHYAAGEFLVQQVDYVMSERVPNLDAEEGVWHPSGFMVFRLGNHAVLGSMRLHVWPEGFRNREERGRGYLEDLGIWDGDAHNHAWYVDGLNIKGYRDKLFRVNTFHGDKEDGYTSFYSSRRVAELGIFRMFRAIYRDDYTQSPEFELRPCNFREVGEIRSAVGALDESTLAYTLTEQTHRDIELGGLHSIDPHEFHAPVIPDDEFAATLAFNSPRVHPVGPYILIGGETDRYLRPRQRVTVDEWELAKESLLKCTL